MKVAIYSISKNEIDQVDSYMDHLDALGIKPYVLDHSTDGTTEKLRARGAIVDTTPIQDWWWYKGKNAALALCKKDAMLACNIDLDERLSPDFWKIVEQVKPDTQLVQHLYKPEGGKERVRYDWRLHARRDCRWTGPVHEYIEQTGKKIQHLDELLITHWPPPNKNHVPVAMAESAAKAFPDDVRIKALYGRELYFSGRIAEAARKFREYLRLDSRHAGDVCYAHRMLAKCYIKLGQPDRALHHRKIAAQFGSREATVELAHHYMSFEKYPESYAAARQALDIESGRYAPNWDPDAWGFKPHEIISIALYHSGDYNTAQLAAQTALKLAIGEDAARITKNLATIQAAML